MTQNPWGRPEGERNAPPQRGPDDEGIRVKDSRKIDPETYEVREPAAAPEPAAPEAPADAGTAGAPAAGTAEATAPAGDPTDERVAELTKDLQRLSAEYANYRKRVDRDRVLQRDLTISTILVDLLPVLDDVERARDHDELEGGFKAVGEAVEAVAAKYGLAAFGGVGESFDPNVHEAMTSETSDEVEEPTVHRVYQKGYRIKDRVLRPARVAVVDSE